LAVSFQAHSSGRSSPTPNQRFLVVVVLPYELVLLLAAVLLALSGQTHAALLTVSITMGMQNAESDGGHSAQQKKPPIVRQRPHQPAP